MNDLIKNISSLMGLIAVVFGVFFFNENRYTSVTEHVKLEQRVSLNELESLLRDALENMYFYRKLLRDAPLDEELKQKVKEAEEEVANLKEQIKELKKK